jgi:hypothetical protein
VTGLRLVGTVHAIGVDRTGPRVGQESVPDFVGIFWKNDARDLGFSAVIEDAKFDLSSVSRKKREIYP